MENMVQGNMIELGVENMPMKIDQMKQNVGGEEEVRVVKGRLLR